MAGGVQARSIQGLSVPAFRVILLALAAFFPVAVQAQPMDSLRIQVPSSSDGSWARTAVAVQKALLDEGLVKHCEIVYSPGAGGLIGLAEMVSGQRGNGATVLLSGRSLLSAAEHNRSLISLRNATPIARLSGTDIVIAVPARSPISDLPDLIEAIRENGRSINWLGGSEGGVDHLLVMQLTAALGGSRQNVSYEAVPGGGNEELKRLVTERFAAAIGSFEEFANYAKQGRIRIIAISAKKRHPQVNAPTLLEYGLNISDSDWRGVFAPPGLTREQLDRLNTLFRDMAKSQTWKQELDVFVWEDRYLPGAEFGRWLETERAAIRAILSNEGQAPLPLGERFAFIGRKYRWTVAIAGAVIVVLLLVLAFQRVVSRKRQVVLENSLESATEATSRMGVQLEHSLSGASSYIKSEFDRWNLSAAEKEVAWMLLKGLSFRVIGDARGTSDRTVREQARSIYAKSGLENRSSFAAYFLEDFFLSNPGAPQ